MTTDKKSIARKIRLLRERTVENGCSEAEAMSALEAAARLVEEYGIDERDLVMERVLEETREAKVRNNRKTVHVATKYCASPIAQLLGVKVWKSGNAVVFFGFDTDVEVAEYLYAVCKEAVDGGWRGFIRENPARSKAERAHQYKAFTMGMAERLGERIEKLDWEKAERTRTRGDNAMVLVDRKMDAVENALAIKKPHLNLRKARRTTVNIGDWESYDAGRNSANTVNLSRGVSERRAAVTQRIAG